MGLEFSRIRVCGEKKIMQVNNWSVPYQKFTNVILLCNILITNETKAGSNSYAHDT